MRQHDIIIPQAWLLTEAKARIDHPEDLVFSSGSSGAASALNAMVQAAQNPHQVSIKWDGAPALIFGRDADGFVLTDKSGFSSKKDGGMPRTAAELKNMLFMRMPTQPGREDYATAIANLFNSLQAAIPEKFRGYLQGDVLWLAKPEKQSGNFVFTPNKITYTVPVDSALGRMIDSSRVGLVVHSIFDDRSAADNRAVGDINALGLNKVPGLVLMGPEIRDLEKTNVPNSLVNKLHAVIAKAGQELDRFLDPQALAKNQISDLGELMKRYTNQRASVGIRGLTDAPNGFMTFIKSPQSKLTDKKRENIKRYIANDLQGYNAAWLVADRLLALKDYIRHDIDRQVGTNVGASLRGKTGHEGYVADTGHGKIKFVDRPHFMRKDSEDAIS